MGMEYSFRLAQVQVCGNVLPVSTQELIKMWSRDRGMVKVVRKTKKKRIQKHICVYDQCLEKFTPNRYWQKFCSSSCRMRDWEEKHPRTKLEIKL